MINNYENNPKLWGVHSFAGGPTQLPRYILHKLEKEFIKENGKSILDIQRNPKECHEILTQATSDLYSILNIPNQFKVLYCQGGASLLFEALPMNFCSSQKSAPTYTNTGYWSSKALDEARNLCDDIVVGTDIALNENRQIYVPDLNNWNVNQNSAYLHYCDNETCEGLEYTFVPKYQSVPLITDMSSNFLTKQINWNQYDMVYAHAQKNIGIAGSTILIIRPDIVQNNKDIPYMWDLREMITKQSLLNTLPILPIYVNTLMFDWLRQQGDVSYWEQLCKDRSNKLYKIIDNSHGVFHNNVQVDQRSRINVTFTLKDDSTTNKFISKCKENNIIEVKGHRAVGGCRICLYLPIPQLAIDKLCDLMDDFIN